MLQHEEALKPSEGLQQPHEGFGASGLRSGQLLLMS